MGEITVYKCDGCNNIVEKPRDVFRIKLEGDEWNEPDPAGGHSDIMKNVVMFGFCNRCARDIKKSLEKIVRRGEIDVKGCDIPMAKTKIDPRIVINR